MKARIFLLFLLLFFLSGQVSINAQTSGKTFIVTNTNNAGEGSLRAAIDSANQSSTPSEIVFEFAERGTKVIKVIDYALVLQNSITINGLSSPDSIIIDGVDKSISYGIYAYRATQGIKIIGLTIRNFNYGICPEFNISLVDKCIFELNNIGIKVGPGNIDTISNCVISGNAEYGISISGQSNPSNVIITNNIIGLTSNQKGKYPNGVGVLFQGITVSGEFNNNVISGNDGYGLFINDRANLKMLSFFNNYIGTNFDFEDLGNGSSGIFIGSFGINCSFGLKESISNIIGYNKGSGIEGELNSSDIEIYNNYIGVSPDYKPILNKQGGIYLYGNTSTRIEKNIIGFNGGSGIFLRQGIITDNIIGGDSAHYFPNEGYGIELDSTYASIEVEKNIIGYNLMGGISSNKVASIKKISQNLFLGTNNKAILNAVQYPIPQITSVLLEKDSIKIAGNVDSSIISKVEIFAADTLPQTAINYLGNVDTDELGNFIFKIAKSDYRDTTYCFSATATYEGKYTSELSDPVCCENCQLDLSRLHYYVKTDGVGDGSSWETAMSPEDFATYLPIVPDRVTFHIAEGTYNPIFFPKGSDISDNRNKTYEINSIVTLIGGYPADAVTGAVSNPDKFKTVLSGDFQEDDYFNLPNNGTPTVQQIEENASVVLKCNDSITVSLFGLTVQGARINALEAHSAQVEIDRCEFSKNVGSTIKGETISKINITDSYFFQNINQETGAVFSINGGLLHVERSTFQSNSASVAGGVAALQNTEATFINSTFTDNRSFKGSVLDVTSSTLKLVNNTIVGNWIYTGGTGGSFINTYGSSTILNSLANIIAGNGATQISVSSSSLTLTSSYNIYSFEESSAWPFGNRDTKISVSEMPLIMDGTVYPGNNTIFFPNIRDNGGWTKTAAIIGSVFSGGAVCSLPIEKTEVAVDQRGYLRKDTCCIGAYEYPTLMDYYVKIDGTDVGSSWEKAMSPESFATYFPIVPDNATFHIAAGTYHPLLDTYSKKTTERNRSYRTCRPVNLVGGYPADAVTGALSEPLRYHTILSGDFNKDDQIKISEKEYQSIEISNISDNGYMILSISQDRPGVSSLYGIEFTGSVTAPKYSNNSCQLGAYNSSVENVKFKVDQCSFYRSYAGLGISYCDTAWIRECRFFENGENGIILYQYTKRGQFFIEKSTFNLNLCGIYNYSENDLLVSNSTFVNNNSSLRIYSISSKTSSSRCSFYNNTILEKKEKYGSSFAKILTYDFVGNIFGTENINLVEMGSETSFGSVSSTNNIYINYPDASGFWNLGQNDILIDKTVLSNILDGIYNHTEKNFEPNLKNNGGFTETVALIGVALPQKKKVNSLPLNATIVVTDQRGVQRDDPACIGAYETLLSLCSSIFLETNPIRRDSDTLRIELSEQSDLHIYLMDSSGHKVSGIESTIKNMSAGHYNLSLSETLDLFNQELEPLTPYLLVIDSGKEIVIMYLYISRL